MPSNYWLEAFSAAIFLINWMPTKTISNISPWQSLFNRTPNYSFLNVFRRSFYPWLRPYTRNKLEFRSIKCVFIGYSLNHKGYRCLDHLLDVFISFAMLSSMSIHFHFNNFLYHPYNPLLLLRRGKMIWACFSHSRPGFLRILVASWPHYLIPILTYLQS